MNFNLDRVLIAFDGSSGHRGVVASAQELGRRFHSTVEMLRVDSPRGTDPAQKLVWMMSSDEGLNRAAADQIQDFKVVEEGKQQDGIAWVLIEAHEAAPAILNYAESEGVSLIVLETHKHRTIRRRVFGGTASEIVRWSRCPVLSIPQSWSIMRGDDVGFRSILVPVDYSDDARVGLGIGIEVAQRYSASLSVIHVADRAIAAPDRPGRHAGMLSGQEESDSTVLTRFCEELGDLADLEIHYYVRAGRPANSILDAVQELAADLVVISAYGRSRDTRYALGSVSDRVIRFSTCPVLVARPLERAEEDSSQR